jgi:teichuronic acid biosynthesis glycosyltransferase TuaG
MDKVSIIIPTYNRFFYLLNTINSIKNQTYSNIEIIVINDCSTEKEYYEYNWIDNGIIILHLKENTKNIFGYACAGYVRNKGIDICSGKYIAFCDDDDIWFPRKIELQINAMKETGVRMSCSEGLFGFGTYDSNKEYAKYNSEYYYDALQNIFKNKGSNLLENGFPKLWNLDFIKIHNCIICSSVVLEKSILDIINNMKLLKNGQEDYDCWLRALELTNCVYVDDILFYYDGGHGNGQNY